jgi:hypothetical protein
MIDPKILDRVRALLALAEGNANANESANAMAQAQKLIEAHRIDQAALSLESGSPEEHEELDTDTLDGSLGRNVPEWRWTLASSLAKANGSFAFMWKDHEGTSSFKIAGRPSDATTVRYLYSYVSREIDRLALEACRERSLPKGAAKSWANNFRIGAAREIAARVLQAQRDAQAAATAAAAPGTALVLVRTAIARVQAQAREARAHATAAHRLVTKKVGGGSNYNPEARNAGQRAGKNIDLGRGASPALGAGRKAIDK